MGVETGKLFQGGQSQGGEPSEKEFHNREKKKLAVKKIRIKLDGKRKTNICGNL